MSRSLLDGALDATVFFSFDRSGFRRHARTFEELDVDLGGRSMAITGANSGLGFAAASALARRGARVRLVCRSAERGARAVDSIRETTGSRAVELSVADMGSLADVRALADQLGGEPLDVLIHNAGALHERRIETADGIEATLAVHVVGPFLLTSRLLPCLRRSSDARVVWVSSGGMYARRLDLRDLQWTERRFDGVAAYAMAKRMQVVLNELWAERYRDSGIGFHCMHPGWADTPGVRRSLPGFRRWMGSRLRSPEQGSDTVVWLAATDAVRFVSGQFWFDRRKVPTHLLPWTREDAGDRERLWDACRSLSGLAVAGRNVEES